jgi:hypothetical protein
VRGKAVKVAQVDNDLELETDAASTREIAGDVAAAGSDVEDYGCGGGCTTTLLSTFLKDIITSLSSS